jgi:phosphatidate cytidylyltransferase
MMYALFFHLPYLNYLALNISVVMATIIGSFEVRAMIEKRGITPSRYLAPLLGASIPVTCYLAVAGLVSEAFPYQWTALAAIVLLAQAIVVKRKAQLPSILSRVSASLLVLLYPGFFLSFLVLITGWEEPSFKILFLVSLVFSNDIIAWFFGNLFGRSMNLIVSPNKSVVGFVAGVLGSVAVGIIFYFLLPGFFTVNLIFVILFSLAIGLITIIGDLVESAFKRSAAIKDSGTIMVGRGGILDSLDSLSICTPFFYLLFEFIGRR